MSDCFSQTIARSGIIIFLSCRLDTTSCNATNKINYAKYFEIFYDQIIMSEYSYSDKSESSQKTISIQADDPNPIAQVQKILSQQDEQMVQAVREIISRDEEKEGVVKVTSKETKISTMHGAFVFSVHNIVNVNIIKAADAPPQLPQPAPPLDTPESKSSSCTSSCYETTSSSIPISSHSSFHSTTKSRSLSKESS